MDKPEAGTRPEAPAPAAAEPAGDAQLRSAGPSGISRFLRLRTFLYLLGATGLFLFQIKNTIAIKQLAYENEKLREAIVLSTSVIASQELKVNELLSIRNITGDAESLGLGPSAVPPIVLEP